MPIYKLYVAEVLTSTFNNLGFNVDTVVTHAEVQDASPSELASKVDFLLVSIVKLAVNEQVPVNTAKFEIPFSLTELTPRKKLFPVSLPHLPNPSSGPVTKFDSPTGGLWTKQFGVGGDSDFTLAFSVGFTPSSRTI